MKEYGDENEAMEQNNLSQSPENMHGSFPMQDYEPYCGEDDELRETGAETAPVDQEAREYAEPNTSQAEQFPQEDAQPDPVLEIQNDGSYHFCPASDPVYTTQTGTKPSEVEPRQAAPVESAPAKKHGSRGSGSFRKKAVALVLSCALLSGAAGFGGSLLASRMGDEKQSADKQTSMQVAAPRETANLNIVSVESGKLMTASQVYKTNVNSTVGITTEIQTTNFWGYPVSAAAAGSGFIISEDGYILTNYHVIENASTVQVAMFDGTTYAASLIGYDAGNDIAVLKVDAKGLTPVTLGNSDSLEVGDEVVAIGNPLGELTFSLTKGNVSALNRPVTFSGNVSMKLIQTDAAINSGNSGGALFNMYGEVVGITNAKFSANGYSGEASIDNIGFAIPINSVQSIVKAIIEKGYISKPYIGIRGDNVSDELQRYGMPKGAAVVVVEKDSPAEKGGLQSNDIVTAINGEAITCFDDLAKIISSSEPGEELKFTVYRKGETAELTITVGEKTQDALPQNQQNSQSQQGSPNQIIPYGNGGSGDFPWGWFFGG